MTYDDWCEHHLTMFGLNSDQDAKMILEWARLFESEGYTVEELYDATKFMALNDPPKFRTDHLAQIKARIRDSRTREQSSKYDHPLGECGACGSTGFIGVPSAGTLTKAGNRIDDDSVKTMSVRCACAMGRAFLGIQGVLSIDEYEKFNPDWRDDLARIKVVMKRRLDASKAAGDLDTVMGAILAKARKYG